MLEKTDGMISNLEDTVQSIEFAKMSNDMLDAMKAGNAALDELQKEMSIDDVEQIMDDARDGVAWANEVNELLAGKLTADDESNIEAELAAFVGDDPAVTLDELPDAPTNEPLPDVPSTQKPAAVTTTSRDAPATTALAAS